MGPGWEAWPAMVGMRGRECTEEYKAGQMSRQWQLLIYMGVGTGASLGSEVGDRIMHQPAPALMSLSSSTWAEGTRQESSGHLNEQVVSWPDPAV